ncbi:MAG: hypothetical protein P4L46_20270 [Fimbriimonas sp.]|nr:hypothetical protein [Fimbriimonas sp.]
MKTSVTHNITLGEYASSMLGVKQLKTHDPGARHVALPEAEAQKEGHDHNMADIVENGDRWFESDLAT